MAHVMEPKALKPHERGQFPKLYRERIRGPRATVRIAEHKVVLGIRWTAASLNLLLLRLTQTKYFDALGGQGDEPSRRR